MPFPRTFLPIVLVFFSLSVFSLSVFSQENFKEGYVVLPNRDTIRGQIDFREWVNNPSKIVFQGSGKAATYMPTDLKAFTVNGEIYRSFNLRIYPFSLSPVVTASENWKPDPYDSTVFLRLITGGKLSLYYYKDHHDLTYFFAQEQEGMPVELRINNRVVDNAGLQSVSTELLYQDQLAAMVADCERTADRGARIAYTEKALRKLVFAYNNCGKDTTEQRSTTEQTHGHAVRFMPMAGFVHAAVRITGALDEARMNWPSYNTFAAGMGMEIVVPRAREQFSVFTDLLFQRFSSPSSTVLTLNSFTTETGIIDFNLLKLDIQFRYRYPEGKVRPFFNIGFSNSLIINNKSHQAEHNSFNNTNSQAPIFGVDGGIKSFQVGIIGGLGVMAGRWSVEARAERLPGISDLESIGSPMTSYYLLLGFRL